MAEPVRAAPRERRSGTRVGVAGLYKDPSDPPTPFLAPRPRSRVDTAGELCCVGSVYLRAVPSVTVAGAAPRNPVGRLMASCGVRCGQFIPDEFFVPLLFGVGFSQAQL